MRYKAIKQGLKEYSESLLSKKPKTELTKQVLLSFKKELEMCHKTNKANER